MKFLANAMGNGDKKIPLPILVIEVFSIVLGVMLALWASEWSDDRNNQKLANKALENVAREFEGNHRFLTTVHEVNVNVVKFLEGEEADSSNLSFIPALQLQATAWETLLNAGVSSYLDYEMILKIAKVYSMHDIYRDFASLMIRMSFELEIAQPADSGDEGQIEYMKRLVPMLNLILEVERAILEGNLEVHEMLNSKGIPITYDLPGTDSDTTQESDSLKTADTTQVIE